MLVSFFVKPATREELETTELNGAPVRADDSISRRLGVDRPSVEQFAEYWNYQLQMGYRVFAGLGPSQFLDVRFEDLIASPHAVMERIADFFDMPESPGWIDKAAGMVNVAEVKSSMNKLTAAQQVSLLKACEPGRILLGRYQHPWIYPTLKLIKEVSEHYERKSK
jgi:hypothetical protein